MRDIDDFLPLINVWAPAAPEPVTLNFLRQAAKELCQRTRCWRFTDSFETTGDDIEVMCTPPYADLFEIEWARFFSREELAAAVAAGEVKLPASVSIASRIIAEWRAGRLA